MAKNPNSKPKPVKRDNFMNAEEALAYGLIDRIITHHE